MDVEPLVDAKLMVVLGLPDSGQDVIVEQLMAVGLISGDDLLRVGSTRVMADSASIGKFDWEGCSRRIDSERRTVLVAEIGTLNDYELLGDCLIPFTDSACLIVMDSYSEAVIEREADPEIQLKMREVAQELESGGPRWWGMPTVVSSVFSFVIEGQDEW